MLHQELGMLILKLWSGALHRRTIRKWGSKKLPRLRNAGPSVASGVVARENYLALAILLHLLQLILDDDGLINQVLQIWVVDVEQLQLDVIIETLEKHVLLLLIGIATSVAYLDS
jgi:hypothetical protein